jgi:DNA-binding MarR family transcriptional regulator
VEPLQRGTEMALTFPEFLRDFLQQERDIHDRYLTAAELDAIREIANSGFDPTVIRRHHAIGRPAVRRFLDELVKKGFLRPEQLPRSTRGGRQG